MAIRVSLTPPTGYRVSFSRGEDERPRRRGAADDDVFDLTGEEVVQALEEQDLELVEAISIEPEAEPRRRRTRAGQPPPEERAELLADLAEDEQAVVLVEQDGLYTWSFGEEEAPPAVPARRGEPRPARRLRFEVPLHADVARARRRRGPVRDFVIGKVTAYVLRFVAREAADLAIERLESKVRTGLVRVTGPDVTTWTHVDDPADVPLPADRAPRILLLVHGTFSSTAGSYGALGAGAGTAFLEAALAEYDAVLGFDHRTLSVDPLANARDLLQALHGLKCAEAPEIDAVAFSRGGLVFRSLVERLLPNEADPPHIGRVVYVACTNGGTRLADEPQWRRLIDLYTTIVVSATRALGLLPAAQGPALIIRGAIQGVAALAKGLAGRMLTAGGVPGLAAMDPDGTFVTDLNGLQPGQPAPGDTYYCAITSEFDHDAPLVAGVASELPSALLVWLADGVVDQVMREPNDLVVHTSSMTAIDPAVGAYVRDRLDFGRNGSVYHCNYFHRPEVAAALARWLALPGYPVLAEGRGAAVATPSSAVHTDIFVAPAEAGAGMVRRLLRRSDAPWCVINRGSTYWYAFERDEIDRLLRRARGEIPVEAVLDLHEHTASRTAQLSDDLRPVSLDPGARPTTARTIVFDEARPVGVLRASTELPDVYDVAAELRTLAPPRMARGARRMRGEGGGMRRAARRPAAGGDYAFEEEERAGAAPEAASGEEAAAPEAAPPRAAPPPPPAAPPADTAEPEAAPPAGGAPEAPPTARIHTRAEMLDETVLDDVSSVHVTLAREALAAASEDVVSADAATTVRTDKDLIVQVVAKENFEVEGDERAVVPAPAPGDPLHLTFDLRAVAIGRGEVWVQVRQGPVALVTLKLVTQIVRQLSGAPRRVAAERAAAPSGVTPTPADVLRITEEVRGNAYRLGYFVEFRSIGVNERFASPLIDGDLAAYITRRYVEIEERYAEHKDEAAAFERDLRSIGASLFEELFPPELQRLLWKHRQKLSAVHVLSTEPYVPWEVVFLKDPDQRGLPKDGLFLAELGMVRWMYEGSFPPQMLRARANGRVRYVIPEYPRSQDQLPSAKDEARFLEQEFRAKKLAPSADKVYALIEEPGSFDVLHFGCHGLAEAADIADARLMMEGRLEGRDYIEDWVLATTVDQIGRLESTEGERPLIVINACQTGRAGKRLTSIGGFAAAFIRAGAGAVVAAHWSVGDDLAAAFVQALYRELKAGKTLAEATRAARASARTSQDATWLAYTVYGEPGATLSLK